MRHSFSVRILLHAILIMVLGTATSSAAPTRYALDQTVSQVGFIYVLNGAAQKGTMPVSQADLVIDPENLSDAKVDVQVSVEKARTGLIFATDALKAPSVLDAGQFPTIRFVATAIHLGADGRLSNGARIDGDITMRGVTRPASFQASLFRMQGSAPDDLSTLTIRLTGAVRRSDFGASGYADLVGDVVQLDIVARIQAQR
jgi:polyisoprenoid-binding protein YceI